VQEAEGGELLDRTPLRLSTTLPGSTALRATGTIRCGLPRSIQRSGLMTGPISGGRQPRAPLNKPRMTSKPQMLEKIGVPARTGQTAAQRVRSAVDRRRVYEY